MKRLAMALLLVSSAFATQYHKANLKDVATGKVNYPAVRMTGIVCNVRTGEEFTWITICESRARKYCAEIRFERHRLMIAPTAGATVEVKAERLNITK